MSPIVRHPFWAICVTAAALLVGGVLMLAREYRLKRKLGKDYEGPLG